MTTTPCIAETAPCIVATVLHIAEIVLYVLLALNTGYLLLFALASKFYRKKNYPVTTKRARFAVLFPAYKEDKVITPAVHSFLQQDYPAELYDVIVISDQMQESTNETLRQLPIRLLKANYTDSSKAKALSLAVDTTADIPYDAFVIMDADNTTDPSFLTDVNRAFQAGTHVIQAHRTAKNMNTDIAILDAVSEEINNSIFRSGHIALGLSSALIGSGMILDAGWFRQHVHQLETAGEDKEMEALLLKQKIHIGYLEDVYVKDEKTQKKEGIQKQRKRWIAAQFDSLTRALPDLLSALAHGNINYCDKIIQWTLLPRIIVMFCVFFFTLVVTVIQPILSIKWWILAFALAMALFIAIPARLLNGRLLHAVMQMPALVLITIGNLFGLKGVNKKFIHTEHGEH